MIEINLLPRNLRKAEKKINVSYRAYIVLLVILLFFLHVLLFSLGMVERAQVNGLAHAWDDLSPKSKDSAQTREQIKVFEADIDLMKGLFVRKVVLTELFSSLNTSIPKGLWLERLSYSKDGLVIQGSVVSLTQNEMTIIGKFLQSLKGSNVFSSVFSKIELTSVQRRMIKTYDVVDFILVGEFKSEKD